MLVKYSELFKNKFQGEYAIPAFNTHDLETTIGIIQAAVSKNAPVIIEVSPQSIEYAGLSTIESIVATLAADPKVHVPIALHLDHTKDEETIKKAIGAGFSSVMIDASKLPFKENIALTKKVVDYARRFGVWVQGELGRLRGNEDYVSVSDIEELFTDPEEAEEFVKVTRVNTLAIAVGTIHGMVKYREKITPHLDIERIRTIAALVKIPIILHGASGVPQDQLQKAIKAGICVVNIDTELRLAFTAAVRETVKDPEISDPRKLLTPAIAAVKAAAEKKFDELNTTNKA